MNDILSERSMESRPREGQSPAGGTQKILFYVPQLTVGGTERHLLNLVTHLDRERFCSVVWCPGPWGPVGEAFRKTGIEILRSPMPASPFQIVPLLAAVKTIREKNFDIFHSYGYGPHYLDAVIAKWARIPVYISSRRNIRHWEGGGRLHGGERVRNHCSDLIIANSQAVRDIAQTIEGIPPERIEVIYNGIPASEVVRNPDTEGFKKRFGIPQGSLVVGQLANFKKVKGQEFLLNAFAAALRTCPQIFLVMAGEGPERETLERQAGDLAVEDHVLFLDPLENPFELLDCFDIAVSSSMAEGFSNVIIEAMAFAKPVIATRTGGNPEAVVHLENGFLVDPGDETRMAESIIRLAGDAALREEFSRASYRKWQDQFQLTDKIKQYETIYARLSL